MQHYPSVFTSASNSRATRRKMKVVYLLLAVFGLACAKSLPTRNLEDDLMDFLELVPGEQIAAIIVDYIQNDAEFQEFIVYLQSDEFEKIVTTIDHLPEFTNFLNFLQEHGLRAYFYFNSALAGLGIPTIAPPSAHKSTRRGVGINGLIDDVLAILPIEELKALFNEKLETSPDFKAFFDAVRGPEFQSIVATLVAMPEYQDLKQQLRDKGVDIDHYIDLIKALFGVSRATRDLEDDLLDFIALLPVEEIGAIISDYIHNDVEVQEALTYLLSDDFEKIVITIDHLPEFTDFMNFLQEHGLKAYQYFNNMVSGLGIPTIAPPTSNKNTRRGVGLNGLIEDVLAILPIEEIKALFYEKLETSPDFKAFYDAVGSPEFQSIVKTLNAMPEYQDMLQKLRDKGVDIDHYIQLIREAFGVAH